MFEKLGRVDFETTANIGVIRGGLATNIIPNHVHIIGEARSHSEEKLRSQVNHMRKCFEEAISRHELMTEGKRYRARLEDVRCEHRSRFG